MQPTRGVNMNTSAANSSKSLANESYISTIQAGFKHFCILCKQGFYDARSLKDHVRIHHLDAPEAFPFICDVCQQGFFTKWGLKQHKEKHSAGSKCEYCNQVFTYYSNLIRHWASAHLLKKCQRCKQMIPLDSFEKHFSSCLIIKHNF